MMSRRTIILFVWLIIGAAACGQRGYFAAANVTCSTGATIAVTIAAGTAELPRRRPDDLLQLAHALHLTSLLCLRLRHGRAVVCVRIADPRLDGLFRA